MDTIQNNNPITFRFTGKWNIQSKQFNQKFSQRTAEDPNFQIVKKNELLTRVETGLYKKREDVIHIINKGQQGEV